MKIFDSKRRHYRKKKAIIRMKIWDLEFLRFQFRSMREGFRAEHDRMKEHLDAAKRRLAGERYTFYYTASGDEISYKAVPVIPDDLLKLPDEPKDTKDFRFWKKKRDTVNEVICKNLESSIQKLQDDLEQLKKQMDGVDGQVEGQNGVDEKLEGMKTAIGLINEYMKKNE